MQKTGQRHLNQQKHLVTTYLSDIKSKVDACIFDFLPTAHEHPDVHQLYQMMLDYPRRARERVCVLRSACLCVRRSVGDPQRAVNTAALALELLQNWLLIHDDIEDGSELRRGEPCPASKARNSDGDQCRGRTPLQRCGKCCHRNTEILGHELAFRILSEFIQPQ